jgi:hypothetical protein
MYFDLVNQPHLCVLFIRTRFLLFYWPIAYRGLDRSDLATIGLRDTTPQKKIGKKFCALFFLSKLQVIVAIMV